METERPSLSIVVPTIRGWPKARLALDPLIPQAQRVGAEILVVDGSGRSAPSELAPLVRWEQKPGWSVFQMRAWAYRHAAGEIVAATEDHCVVADDWCERILAAHREFPDAMAVGGAVLNGTDQKAVDWAAFLLTQGPFMPPLGQGPARMISGPANVSYKRAALDRLATAEGEGLIDWMSITGPDADGALIADDRIRVRHHQSQGFWGTSLAEFDNGRTIASFRRPQMTKMDWLRVATVPIMPLYRSLRSLRRVRHKYAPPPVVLRAAPILVWFQYCASVGEFLGYTAGPGDSPRRLY